MSDLSSLSNISVVKCNAMHLSLAVDFEKKLLTGHVDLSLEIVADTSEIHLDTRDLDIQGVRSDKNELEFMVEAAHPAFGSRLVVTLPQTTLQGSKIKICVTYATSPTASAIQWLTPSQTAGGVHPYLFTQCQAIHARSLVPCQDSPGMKVPYTAEITVPSPLAAVMSASSTGSSQTAGHTTFKFEQSVPISTYLIALAVGAIECREIGTRTKLWTEPAMMEASYNEFAETERYLDIAEKIAGPYQWGTYGLLVLPPSFPYGGMENPMMTFVTPTLLAGDRSLVDVVAHEIAHSWTGNLVTNRFWSDFWLNEGFTVYLERRIMGDMWGEEARHFSAILGLKHLKEDLAHFGLDNPLTQLVPNLEGIDPDDAFSSCPYEKGFNLLFYLEGLVGGKEIFEKFLKAYIAHFANSSLTTAEFQSFFEEFFTAEHPIAPEILKQIEWDAWLRTPGLPAVTNTFDTTLARASTDLAARILSGAKYTAADINGWAANQVMHMLDSLLGGGIRSRETCDQIEATFGFSDSGNAEIKFRWFLVAVEADYESVNDRLVKFLKEQGRMKFVRPLYRALFNSRRFKELALETFKDSRAQYHSIAAKMIARDLKIDA